MTNSLYRAALIGLLILTTVQAKRTRRIKNPKPEEDSSPQPSVVSYSTFGFNDVGSYDGFVPSSPDYATYLSKASQQDSSGTRLYAPAFPSSLEDSGPGNNFGSQSQDGQTSGADDNAAQPSMLHYNSASYFNPANLNNHDQDENVSPEEKYRRIVDEESNSPVYGTKLGGSKTKQKLFSQYNDTAAFDVYSSGPSSPSESNYPNFKEQAAPHETKPTSYGESASSHQNIYNYAPTYPPTEADEVKPSSNNTYSFNYPKVIDFTKYKQYYPSEIETKFPTATFQPVTNKQNENKQTNNYETHSSSFNYPSHPYKNTYKVTEEDVDKEDPKPSPYTHHDYSNNFVSYTSPKSTLKGTKSYLDYKDKVKHSPWASSSQNTSTKNWRNPIKGYEYSTDYSNMSFKYDTSSAKKPFSIHTDELTPASSNVVDLSNYKFPETDYSSFKKIPGVKAHYDDDYSSLQSKYKDLFKSDDYINQFKNLYNSPSTSSLWGNVYKGPEFTSQKHHSLSAPYGDEITNDVVHVVPKKPQSHKYKHSDSKPSEWSYQNKYRPYKGSKPNDWTKDVSLTRFKSEEDLLGLRTHDTSHPSYLPSYKPFNEVSDEFDYKKLVEKWRQSYLKSKYKEAFRNDFETYASEAKPVHVPIPKPYAALRKGYGSPLYRAIICHSESTPRPFVERQDESVQRSRTSQIEVPRPVIVPVPEPYPVRVPIPKPVAVPVIKELTVQIVKPVPYPVYKKVPYPVEKPVPVPVVKQVPVPVMKPYPVPVPHVRPVFHHTRPHEEFDAEPSEEDDDYLPRPDSYRTSKKVPYSKRVKNTRYRARRPLRATHQDRNRRRWPERRPSYPRGPSEPPHSPYRSNYDEQEFERSDYYLHCKRTGRC